MDFGTLELGFGTRQGGAWTPHFWVDSENGDDGDDGTTAETAFQTLTVADAAADLLGTAARVALVAGSAWNEEGYSRSAADDVRVMGEGDPPEIDASEIVTSWTLIEGRTNAYSSPVSHDSAGSNRVRVYDPTTGALLTRVADEATCDSTPGSFVDAKASDGNPLTIKIHLSDSSDPDTKPVRVTVRNIALKLGANAKVFGPLITKRAMSNNGSLEIGANADVRQHLAVDGSKHNMLVGSGSVRDSICCRCDPATSYELSSTYFVSYLASPDDAEVSYTRCGAVAGLGGSRRGSAFIQHGSDATSYGRFSGDRLWSVDASEGWIPSAKIVRARGLYAKNNNAAFSTYTDDGLIEYFAINNTADAIQSDVNRLSGAGAVVEFKNLSLYMAVTTSNTMFRPGSGFNACTLKFTNCVFHAAAFIGSFIGFNAWTSGTIEINNCIFVYSSNGNPVQIPSGVTYIGNNNVFLCNTNGGTNLNLTYSGSTYDTIADWRTATGQDADSIALGPSDLAALWAGTVANGDFRLGGSGAGAAAAAIGAGLSHRLDWGTGAVSAGAMQAWPDVPETLAECETYISDPSGWDFHP